MPEQTGKPAKKHSNTGLAYVLLTTLLFTGHWLHLRGYFSPEHIHINDAQIKHILQLTTQEVTLTMPRNHSDSTYHLLNIISSEKSVEYTAVATIKFGYDLADLRYRYDETKQVMRILRLPPVKVLDVFIEIKEFNVFKSGWLNSWTPT